MAGREAIPIIGGTGALGYGLALRWARAGRAVVIGSRSEERAADAATKLSKVAPDAAAAGPFGTTVAHGFLTLSLLVPMLYEVMPPHDGVTVNYGVNRVRFPAPLPSGSRIRATFEALAVEDGKVTLAATVEREGGGGKPVCVAELVLLLVPATGGSHG